MVEGYSCVGMKRLENDLESDGKVFESGKSARSLGSAPLIVGHMLYIIPLIWKTLALSQKRLVVFPRRNQWKRVGVS